MNKIRFTHPLLPSNVRLIAWENGYHIYAKVDNEDVVDKQGNQKWSNVKEAENAVRWYMSNNKKQDYGYHE